MYRNLHARVEAICPIYDKAAKEKLWNVLQLYLNDGQQTWLMKADGSYEKKAKSADSSVLGVQNELMRQALFQENFTEDDLFKEEKE